MGFHPPLKSSRVTVEEPNFTYEAVTKTIIEILLPWPQQLMHEFITWGCDERPTLGGADHIHRWYLPLTELIQQLGDLVTDDTIPTDRFTDVLRMVGQLEVIDRKYQREQIGNTVIVIPQP